MLTKQDLSQIKNILQEELKPINKKLNKLEKKNTEDHNIIIEYFDNNDIKHNQRFERIEKTLGLPPMI